MIANSVIVTLITSIAVCFLIPIIGIIIIQIKYKKAMKPFLLGAGTFFIFQMVTRIPLLTYVLPGMDWFIILSTGHIYLYSIFLGITAALFEEIGRFITISLFMKKNQRYADGLSFGLGHGGIEAIGLVGLSLINTLVMVLLINSNSLEAQGANQSMIDTIYRQCMSLTPGLILMGMMERIFAICIHIGATMLVLTGFRKGQKLRYLFIAIAVHTIVDSSIGILPAAFGTPAWGLELFAGVFAIGLLGYTFWSKAHVPWQAADVRSTKNKEVIKR